ncbi:spore gernimation protein GerPD [Halalkalibacter krulwichiae]|uniref:Putative spore germination protein GerPD n=1 Tax=Halalkalibacter krulwichiae TaxID=199441 RepID=A0A1X9MBP0_9BACI|nr:spore gernimation protein GerPD [Halalkalibacter krulwichiae]ARK30064.1 putative spore germination protein GerPD [Halalkalibacter krulwichiae]
MNYTVINRHLNVENIRITGVSSSSIFLVGDTDCINLSSIFDTPPESLIIGPFVPLAFE